MIRHIGAACLVAFLFVGSTGWAGPYDLIHRSDYLTWIQDMHLGADSSIQSDIINVDRSIIIENYGIVLGDLHIGDGRHVYLKNSGIFDGDIFLGKRAHLTQIVEGPSDMKNLGLTSDFSVLVQNTDVNTTIRLSDILALAQYADEIIFQNAAIILDIPWPNIDDGPRITMLGEIVLKVDNASNIENNVLIDGVQGDASIVVMSPEGGIILNPVIRWEDESAILEMWRETDYQKILGQGSVGQFLNIMRDNFSHDKLMTVLNAAQTRHEIFDIIDRSVRINPINLMTPVRMLHDMELMDGYDPNGVGASTWSVYSNQLNMRGVSMFAGATVAALSFGVRGHVATFDYSDEINEYIGSMYGGDVRGHLKLKHMWIRGALGITMASFDVGPVLGDDRVLWDPDGQSIYGAADIGVPFHLGKRFSLAPFVGVMGGHDRVADDRDQDIRPRGGMRSEYIYEMDGLRYGYTLNIMADTNGMIIMGAGVDVFSDADGAGGGLRVDMYYDNDITSWRLGINGRMMF